jgi:hypoxanthine phosphoribosyltransferase
VQPGIPCEIVGWDAVHDLARDLAFRIRDDGFDPEIIVALGRGGWVPGRLLSDYLGNLNLTEFKVEHYKGTEKQPVARVRYPLTAEVAGRRVLLVDDVTDTGDSFDVALAHVRSRGEPREIRTVVLHHKTISPYVPDYFGREVVEWRWIIYPWAMVEDLTALIGGSGQRPSGAEAIADQLLRDHGIRVSLGMVRDVLALMNRRRS